MLTLLDLCVSSLRRGHANLLCIVPILTDDPRRVSALAGPAASTLCKNDADKKQTWETSRTCIAPSPSFPPDSTPFSPSSAQL